MQTANITRGTGDTASPSASTPGLESETCAIPEDIRKLLSASASTPGLESETWTRLPANGGRLEGLSRAALYRIQADKDSGVVSVAICQPGSNRGVRLIGLQSLRAYIARCAKNQIAARLAEKEAA